MNQKGFAQIAVIIGIVLIAAAIGYFALVKKEELPAPATQSQQVNTQPTPSVPQTATSTPAPTTTPPQNPPQGTTDGCAAIRNSVFESVSLYGVGRGPTGTELGHWRITLQGSEFSWIHSDFGEAGTYTCRDNVLEVKFYDHSASGRYDPGAKLLIWEGVEYKKYRQDFDRS